MKNKRNEVICPPCGENVGLPTKRGANKVSPILPRLPRLTAVLPPQGREITARGFTLIELLVVVLIIGILAAVAVPQYQKAVEKTHLAETLQNINAIQKCLELYKLENGLPASGQIYLPDMNCPIEVDLEPASNGRSIHSDLYVYDTGCSKDGCWIEAQKRKRPYHSVLLAFNGEKTCYTSLSDLGRYICKSIENQGWEYVDEEY